MKTLMKQLQWAAETALFTASVLADAPDVDQNVDNTGGISVNTQMPNTGDLGQGASASISASGAVGSVSISGNGGGFVYPTDGSVNGFGSVTQTIDNTGTISNGTTTPSTIAIGDGSTAGDLGQGAVASIGATGATASVSVNGNGATALGDAVNLGAVTQSTTNSGVVTNGDTGGDVNTITSANLAGDGSAAAISAGGASSSVGLSFNNSELDGAGSANNFSVGAVTQTSLNSNQANDGPNVANYGTISLGTHAGDGASASISAAGASTSVSLSSINSAWDDNSTPGFAGATQTATNGATGSTGGITNEGDLSITSGGIAGVGGSASISASGSIASVGVSSIGASSPSPIAMADINQTSANYMAVSNTGTVDLGGGGLAQGAGASAGATGAAASVSFRTITPPAP